MNLTRPSKQLVTAIDKMIADKPIKYKCYSFLFFHYRVVKLIAGIRNTINKDNYSIRAVELKCRTCRSYMDLIDETYVLIMKYDDQLTAKVTKLLKEGYSYIKENYSLIESIVQEAKRNYKR